MAVSTETGFSVNVRSGDVETLGHHRENRFSVTIYSQHKTGNASSSDFSENAIADTISKAYSIATLSHPDPFAGLPDEHRLAKHYPDCALYHPWTITPTEAIEKAIQCEKIALAMDARITQCEGVSISSFSGHHVLANTLGFLGDFHSSVHHFSCSMVAEENHCLQRDDEYTVSRRPSDLDHFKNVTKRAAEKTVARLGARSISTQTCPVIFEAPVAKSLLSAFVQAISGSNLYRCTSFLCDSLGHFVFPKFMNIFQEPHLLNAMGSAPFDSEGVATENLHYVKQGELVSYVLGTYSAKKLGLQSTGNAGGVYNLSTTHTHDSLQAIIKKMHRGLLVTELMGQGINITTGDYSRGATGFWIDHGEIQFPVEEITIAGNLKNMFQNIIGISNDIDIRSSIRSGSILISQMTVAGKS